MNSPRSLANQKLYHARIVADGWRDALKAEQVPALILGQAFEPAARAHLRQSYGWFLLDFIQIKPLPDTPPESCDALPAVAPGKAFPGELRELQRLEKDGWLSEMLAAGPVSQQTASSASNLAVSMPQLSSPDQIDQWITLLQGTFDRLAEFIDEY